MVVMNGRARVAVEQNGHPDEQSIPVDEYLYLAGRPPLRGYLHFMTGMAGNGAARRELVEQFRAAEALLETLAKEEAGWADDPPMQPLSEHLQPLVQELHDDAIFQRAFDTVPTDIAIVELDRLVVYQKHINLTYAAMLRERLSRSPRGEALFRACLPVDHPHPEARWMRTHDDTWVCVSPSNDMRFLDTTFLEPGQVQGYARSGPLTGVIAAMVGFGSNFLNAFHVGNRLVLNNGSHRAYALRELGITHVPCIVQHFASREEVKAFGSYELRRRPELYVGHPRPPLLKDYFDPRLRSLTRGPRRYRQVRVTVRFEQSDYPAL